MNESLAKAEFNNLKISSTENFYILHGSKDSVFHPKIKNLSIQEVFFDIENDKQPDLCLTITNDLLDFISSSLCLAKNIRDTEMRVDFIENINSILYNKIYLFEHVICSVAFKEDDNTNVIQLLNDKDSRFENISAVVEHIKNYDYNNYHYVYNRPYSIDVTLNADENCNCFDITFFKGGNGLFENRKFLLSLRCEI